MSRTASVIPRFATFDRRPVYSPRSFFLFRRRVASGPKGLLSVDLGSGCISRFPFSGFLWISLGLPLLAASICSSRLKQGSFYI